MQHRNGKFRSCSALTIMEVVIALAIVTVIFSAVLPQLRLINNSWDSKQGAAEVLQNGRVLTDHISRNLAKAVRITAVSDSSETDGYIEFEDNDGNNLRYDISDTNYVEYGPVGSLSDLAGPVRTLRFTCYDDNDLDTAVTDVNSIRFVTAQSVFPSSARLGRDKTFTTSVYLRTGEASDCDDGLVGWWKFDETSGTTAADSSGNGNDGTLTNMVGDEWTYGIIGGGLEFDGTSTVAVEVPTTDMSASAGTLALWGYLSEPQPSQTRYLFGHTTQPAYNNRIQLYMDGGNTVLDLGLGDSHTRRTGIMTLETETWYHVALTWDNGNYVVYINGQEVATGAYTGLSTLHNFVWIGNDGNPVSEGTEAFGGVLDDVRIYDRALEPEEVAQLADVLTYHEFNEAKVGSDAESITISTPDTNEGDLLIAAVATDGDTSSSLAAPGGQGWTLISRAAYSGEVTLGAWWKLADASESATHQFTWTGSEKAYGWMMRFTGHDPTDPIDAYSSSGQSSSTPASPAVTTSAENCLILRLGAFDDDNITVDDPGLSGHTAITMDESSSSGGITLFQDGFETSFANWTTDWERSSSTRHSGGWSAEASSNDNDLVSNVINTSGYSSITIDFWYGVLYIDDDDNVYLQLYDSAGDYDNYFEVGNQPEGSWRHYQQTISDPQYLHSNFRIKFEGTSIDSGEYLYVDDVLITAAAGGTVSGGAGYVKQPAAGDSGTSTFALTSANEAQMLTIAIAPDDSGGCTGELRP